MAVNRTSKAKGKVLDIPDAPTIGTATDSALGGTVSVAFTAPTKGGPAFSYTALSSPGSISATGTSSPITVTGLTNNTSYTFTVYSTNPSGNSPYSSASGTVTPSAPPSWFDSIATVTVGSGGASSISFTSIPSTYKHLQVRGILRNGAGINSYYNLYTNINNDTGSNYTRHVLYGSGASASVAASTSLTKGYTGISSASTNASLFSSFICDILDYADTNKYKTMRTFAGVDFNANGGGSWFQSSLWMSTSAITSLTFTDEGATNFAQYSSLALYGVKG